MSIAERRSFAVGEVFLIFFGGSFRPVAIEEVVCDLLRLDQGLGWVSADEFIRRTPRYYGRVITERVLWLFKRRRIVRDKTGELKR